MYKTDFADKYKDSDVLTASPCKLVVLMFEGAISNLKKAEKCIESKKYLDANAYLYKSQAIVAELMFTLDMSHDISHYLIAIYRKAYNCIIKTIKSKKTSLKESIDLLETLLDAWRNVERNAQTTAIPGMPKRPSLDVVAG